MSARTRLTSLVALLCMAGASGAQAQIDYRNLEAGRPLRIEDAYPIERYGFELALQGTSQRRADTRRYEVAPTLEYGFARDAQLSLSLPLISDTAAVEGLAGLDVAGLWTAHAESPALPAFALAAGGTVPFGVFGGQAYGDVGALLTRSLGRWRVHANGAHRLGPDVPSEAPRWWYGLALDRTQYRSSDLYVLEARAERASNLEPIDCVVGVGWRFQLGTADVGSLGVAVRATAGRAPGFELNVGMSRGFAIGALMPRGRRTGAVPTDDHAPHDH